MTSPLDFFSILIRYLHIVPTLCAHHSPTHPTTSYQKTKQLNQPPAAHTQWEDLQATSAITHHFIISLLKMLIYITVFFNSSMMAISFYLMSNDRLKTHWFFHDKFQHLSSIGSDAANPPGAAWSDMSRHAKIEIHKFMHCLKLT